MSDPNFYRDLEPFHSFVDEAFEAKHYVPLPEDWLLVVADITGSTAAVQSGKYAEVNYLGAACIVAVTNAVKEFDLPTVFGGDGATLAVPEAAREATLAALLATQAWGKASFDLDLRVGAVPISEIVKRGSTIAVAKMAFSPGNNMAMFRGDGFDLADTLVKDGTYAIEASGDAKSSPDLESLSCRWSPMPSTNGHMLCLIIGAEARSALPADDVYREVLERINAIASLNTVESSPVKVSSMKVRFGLDSMSKDVKTRQGPAWLNWLKVVPLFVFAAIVFRLKKKVGDFDPSEYMEEMAINADFRKVNGMLRLIIDCTDKQCDEIEALLNDMHDRGDIIFGAHRAKQAIMTCVAPNIGNHEHVHYIDGSEGGLWSAAKGLKEQLRSRW
jgi:hypothetical protein